MSEVKKPMGVGEDTAHRPLFITIEKLDENWKRTFGNSKRRKKNVSSQTRVEKKNRKSSSIPDEEVG
jgi:hypothetical protein